MNNDTFKTCPFCKEKIRASAVKCRYCGEWLESPPENGVPPQPETQPDTRAASIPPTEPASRDTSPTEQVPAQVSALAPPSSETPKVSEAHGAPERNETAIRPNTNLPQWKTLADAIGRDAAYAAFDRNGHDIPDVGTARKLLGPESGWEGGRAMPIPQAKAAPIPLADPVPEAPPTAEQLSAKVKAKKKSRLTTALLNLLLPGAGYIYCGRLVPGLIAFSLAAGVVIGAVTWEACVVALWPSLALVLVIDSLLTSSYYNREPIDKAQLPIEPATPTTLSTDPTSGESLPFVPTQLTGDEKYMPPEMRPGSEERLPLPGLETEEAAALDGEMNHDARLADAGVADASTGAGFTRETPSQVPKKHGNYFVRHWRGELPLRTSYWVNVVLVTILFYGLLGLLSVGIKDADLRITALTMIGANILVVCVYVWQIAGTWRAAGNSKSRGWAATARIVMVLSILGAVSQIVNRIAPQTVEWCSILAGDTQLPPCVIRMLPGGTEMELSGGLRAGSARELARAMDFAPQVRVLHISSTGGRLTEAHEMARLVQQRGLTTYCFEQCLSAATVVFLAGKERVVAPGAKLGFHCGDFPGLTHDQRAEINASEREAMRVAGVADWFVAKVLQTPPESMWYPTFDELLRAGVVTTRSTGEKFTSSRDLSGLKAEDIDITLSKDSTFAAIREIEPETYAQLVADLRAMIKAGKSEKEAVALIGQRLWGVAERYLPAASDEAVLALRDYGIGVLSKYKDKDSRACVAFLTGSPINYAQAFAGWDANEVDRVMKKVIRSGASRQPIVVDKQAATDDLAAILKNMTVKYGTDVMLLQDQAKWMDNSDKVCDILLMMYRQIGALPEKRAANLMRCLWTSKDK